MARLLGPLKSFSRAPQTSAREIRKLAPALLCGADRRLCNKLPWASKPLQHSSASDQKLYPPPPPRSSKTTQTK
eukprot:3465108-Amphidinium_carterae.1